MRIQHNIMAMNAYRNYNNNVGMLSKNLEKLSSGYRINRAGDDAAGLAISEKMRAQITGLDAAQKNVKDGISLVKTAEGAMQEIQDMMNRMVYLATQSANGTYDNEVDRANLQKEVNSLRSEIDRIADSANFNGIKLLDGSLATTQLSEVPVEFNTQTITEGLAINEGSNGGGTAGEFTMDITGMFGTGDSVTIDFSSIADKTLNFNAAGGANTFKGETVEEQAQSIADALNADAAISQKFTVTAEGSSVKLVNKEEGATGKEVVNSFKATDTTVVVPNGTLTAGGPDGGTAKTMNAGFTQLFDGAAGTGGKDIHEGDVLTFTFAGNGGETLTAKVTVTNDMIGATTSDTTNNVVNALKNTSFEEVDGTVFQESKFKVSDFFEVKANVQVNDGTTPQAGSIHFDAVKNGAFKVTNVQVNDDLAVTATTHDQGLAGTAHEYNVAAATAGNFSYGDKMELSGTLADGRTFNLTLTAGEDFEIGATYADSATNLAAALESDKVTVTLNDGTEVKANEIFADTGKEINVTAAAGALTFTSTKTGVMGAGVAGGITNVSVTTAEEASVEETLTAGVDQSSATSSLTFSDGLEYGTTVQIDGKNYELVQDARDASNRNNVAVVVSDLTDTADVASKLAAAINGEYGPATATFNATADGSTVTLATIDVGSDVQAVGISTPYGEEVTTASFKFDTDVVEEGSVFEFNGNSYEFVKTGEKATKAGAIAIEVADFETDTAKILGDAFADVAKGGVVSVADDGTVTLKSLEAADGTISKPTISFGNSLTLQIGDTSDIWNQLSVSIDDMHVAALGIADISIETQPDAQAAVDLIKDAINKVSMTRGTLGATQNRLEHTANNLSVMEENITDAESTIRDTDVADEMMAYTKNNILIQSAQAMLAQANAVPQGVLQLLQ